MVPSVIINWQQLPDNYVPYKRRRRKPDQRSTASKIYLPKRKWKSSGLGKTRSRKRKRNVHDKYADLNGKRETTISGQIRLLTLSKSQWCKRQRHPLQHGQGYCFTYHILSKPQTSALKTIYHRSEIVITSSDRRSNVIFVVRIAVQTNATMGEWSVSRDRRRRFRLFMRI